MVSVIIPNYNHAQFLRQRIESVLQQSYTDLEVILLDDCSTDSSHETIDEFEGHPKISRVIRNPVNSGSVFKQWKKGLGFSRGSYIWIAESDDFADPDFLKSLVPVMDQNDTVALAYCDSKIVFSDSRLDEKTFSQYRKGWLSSTKWERDYIENGRVEISENLLQMCTINNASTVLFRKSALLSVDPFDIDLRFTGDWYCYLKLCMKYDIAYVNKPLSYYREHSLNSFRNMRKNMTFVREYFLIFNWALREVDVVPKKRIIRFFKSMTRHSLRSRWTNEKMTLYRYLHAVNKNLFWTMIFHNLVAPFKSKLRPERK